MMESTRRRFLKMSGFAAYLIAAGISLAAQGPGGAQAPVAQPAFPPPHQQPDNVATLDPKSVMKEDQKSLKKDVEKLFALAQELKDQTEKANTANILPLPLIRKAEQIEKLAHQIQKLAKG